MAENPSSELTTWLGELKLAGYKVIELYGWYWIQGKSSLTVWIVPTDEGYKVSWAQGVGRGFKKTFASFDEMADWVGDKLRSYPFHWQDEKKIGEEAGDE
jgi:hypothetical protein